MSNSAQVLILLSTYNGERFLDALLESIRNQTYKSWRLLIRDDGSNDNTLAIIKSFQEKDDRINLYQDNLKNLTAKISFSHLMGEALKSKENYILFCDQDDVWLDHKIDQTISRLMELEAQNGADTPLLVHSDLIVVDSNLKIIHSSFIKKERLKRNTQHPLKTLLINNYVTGCTMGINKALLKHAYPIPNDSVMHDWWCALCAATFGIVSFLPTPTLLYRQHNGNQIGSKNFLYKLKKSLMELFQFNNRLNKCLLQALSLLKTLNNKHSYFSLVKSFSQLNKMTIVKRYSIVIQHNFKGASLLRRCLFWLRLTFLTKQ